MKINVWLRQVFQSKAEALNLICINIIGHSVWDSKFFTGAGHRKKKERILTGKTIVGI